MKESKERIDKMKKNKGFTLIELLAVIVILAIIALIAVPVVMNIIGKANKSAFKDSAYGLLKAGETFYTSELLKDVQGMTEDKVFTFPNDIEGLEFKGSKPTGGSMTVRKDGKVSMAISNGKYCVTKGFEDEDVTISDDVEDCIEPTNITRLSDIVVGGGFSSFSTSTATSFDDTCMRKGKKCEEGIIFAIKVNEFETYDFYVLNDDGNKVDLIMDENLGGNVAWINSSDYGSSSVKNDKGPLTALRILKERTGGWTNIPLYTYTLENDADGQGGSYTYAPITKSATGSAEESVVENVRARLPRLTDLKKLLLDDNSFPSWLNGKFWTSTTNSLVSENALFYSINGIGGSHPQELGVYASDTFGLRPVITLSK